MSSKKWRRRVKQIQIQIWEGEKCRYKDNTDAKEGDAGAVEEDANTEEKKKNIQCEK